MTAVEKAKELVEAYKKTNILMPLVQAKQCAMICCGEIIASQGVPHTEVEVKIYNYWQEVKREIEKL